MDHRLAKHLEELLLRHHCVVIPSLGGFVMEECPAHYDEATHLAYPPHVRLGFNASLIHQDGLLVERYAGVYAVSLRRARLMLEDDVRRLRQSLARLRSYELRGVGRLTLGADGELGFEAKPSVLLNSPSYGLSAVSLPIYNVPQRTEGSEADQRYYNLRIPKRVMTYALYPVLAVLFLLPWGKYFASEPKEPSYTAGFAPEVRMPKTESTGVISEAKPAVAQAEEVLPQSSSQLPMRELEAGNFKAWVLDEERDKYYVIIATERSLERANSYIEHAKREQLQVAMVMPGRSVYRVVAGRFDTSAEAYDYVKTLPSLYREAWVYRGK